MSTLMSPVKDVYVADDKAMNIVVNALLTKMEDSVASGGMDEETWNKFVDSLTKGVVENNAVLKKVISVELLATVLNKGQFITAEVVQGTDIVSAVETPDVNTLYLLHDPNATTNNLTIWVWVTSKTSGGKVVGTWYSLANAEIPEFTTVNTSDPDHVNNIVSHIRRGTDSYNSSANVRGYDLVSAKALTQVLIRLGTCNKVVIPYEPNATIADIITEPNVNTMYIYQETKSDDSWAMYSIMMNDDGKTYKWIRLTGKVEGPDLSKYWSKEELTVVTSEEITAMVNNAADALKMDTL